MTNTQSTTTETLTAWAEQNGVTRDELAMGVTLAGVLMLMAQDETIRAMFEANDRERFLEGCKSPEFAAKFGQALLAVREVAA